MARAARVIGDGGVIGWLAPETVSYPDDEQPTMALGTMLYIASGSGQDGCALRWLTTATAAETRSQAKDAIRQDIIDKLGITIPKAQIRVIVPE